MFEIPNKFYATSSGGGGLGSPDTPASNKKYEITITQPPEHKSSPDFIRGIPYAAKDNVMFCKHRAITLEDMKEIDPDAETAPSNIHILQDMDNKDIIITSDQIENMILMQIIIVTESNDSVEYIIPSIIYAKKKTKLPSSKTAAYYMCGYETNSSTFANFFVKVSDVDLWC